MRPVSRDEFFAKVGPLNVHPRIVTSVYPYTTDWELLASRTTVGRSVGRYNEGKVSTDYFLADGAH